MTDIIDRLRADTLRSGTWADTGVLMLEAAEEIERLRAALKPFAEHAPPQGMFKDGAHLMYLKAAEVLTVGDLCNAAAAAIRNRSDKPTP